jgi:nicotinate phosphoribosyltransferase
MIIKSILDSDLYKFTMQNAVFQLFPNLKVRYKFIDRNKISFPDGFDKKVKAEIVKMGELTLTKDEKTYMTSKLGRFLPPTYIDFLEGYRFDSSEVNVYLDENNKLRVEIEGYMYRTILWEVPIMGIISELYFIETGQVVDIYSDEIKVKDLNKIHRMMDHNAYFAEFGSRRRYSFANQERVVKLFKENGNHVFVGTSNVYLAYKSDLKAIGSIGHEWIMFHAALYGYKQANFLALKHWVSVYNGDLGTMLPDTYTSDVFFKSFDMLYSKLFDGIRHDSGDIFEFTDKTIAHYRSMGIDSMSKTIIFSNALDIDGAIEIKEYCVNKIKSSSGIGTHLTNDVGVKPLNIVIKISEVLINDEWFPCVKLSDDIGKHTGDSDEAELCKKILHL